MSWVRGRLARVRSLLGRKAAERRTEEEFRFHLEMEMEKHIARGLSPADARREALLRFGGVDRHREGLRDVRRARLFGDIGQDVSFALRSFKQASAFFVAAVFIMALGAGATTAVFSLAHAFLFRPLPVSSPAELYMVQEVRTGAVSIGNEGRRIPYTRYEAYGAATEEVFRGLAAHSFQTVSLRTQDGAIAIQGVVTSGNYFEVLGIAPAGGRFYARDDEPVVVLSHRFWQSRFGGAADVIGQTLYLDGRPYVVTGIGPRGFDGTSTGFGVAAWLPFRAHGSDDPGDMDRWVGVFGRLPADADIGRAAQRVSAVALRIPADEPQTEVERAYLAPLTGLGEGSRGEITAFMAMLGGAGLLVLLIAASNIAAMLLARGTARRREVAVRVALGAGRGRLVRQLLTESTVLFLLGGVGGIGVAYVITGAISRIRIPGVPLVIDAQPSMPVLLFALAVAAFSGLIFGLAPSLAATRVQLTGALKDGAASGGTARLRGRSVFVGAQLALAVVLLVTAGLFVRGLQRAIAIEPGFDAEDIVIGSLNLEAHGLDSEEGRIFLDALLQRLRVRRDIQAATYAQVALLTGNRMMSDTRSIGPDSVRVSTSENAVEASYLGTLSIPLVSGRDFTAADGRGAPPVAIVNETLAHRLWPGRIAVGQLFRRAGTEYRVIGVARDGQYVNVGEDPQPFAFYAAAQRYSPRVTLHVRGSGGPARVLDAVRREIQQLNPDVALELPMALPAMIDFALLPNRFAATTVGLFGLLGLLLAGAGVYAIVSFQVSQRTREFGVRIALGASAGTLLRLVIGRGVVLAAAGALIGCALASAISRLVRGMLFDLNPLDPPTFGAVALILAGVAVLASWFPARRALAVDPATSLRSD